MDARTSLKPLVKGQSFRPGFAFYEIKTPQSELVREDRQRRIHYRAWMKNQGIPIKSSAVNPSSAFATRGRN